MLQLDFRMQESSHSRRMLRTNAPVHTPWDTMPHLSWLECDPPPGRRRRVASIWQREVQIQADGRAEWRAETMQIVCDFSAADGFRRDGHIDNRREAHWQTRPRRRSKLHVAAHARTGRRLSLAVDGRPCAELAGRGSGGHRSQVRSGLLLGRSLGP